MTIVPAQPLARIDNAHRVNYAEAIRSGPFVGCVWGLGRIGWSTVEALCESGVQTVGYDIDPGRVATLQQTLIVANLRQLTDDRDGVVGDEVLVHFVAVPTEREAEPFTSALLDVMKSLIEMAVRRREQGALPPLVIIESTLTPGTVDELVLPLVVAAGMVPDEDFLLALAPRRDWFLVEDYGLRDLDRVFGAIGVRSGDAALEVLSLMCDRLHRASSHVVGEMVKCVENAFRHVEITLANQLTLGYPSVDMVSHVISSLSGK